MTSRGLKYMVLYIQITHMKLPMEGADGLSKDGYNLNRSKGHFARSERIFCYSLAIFSKTVG